VQYHKSDPYLIFSAWSNVLGKARGSLYVGRLRALPGANTLAYSLIVAVESLILTEGAMTLSIMIFIITTFSIMTLSIKGLYVTLCINDTEHIHFSALCLMSRFIYIYA
jgi:hypothetical protein